MEKETNYHLEKSVPRKGLPAGLVGVFNVRAPERPPPPTMLWASQAFSAVASLPVA